MLAAAPRERISRTIGCVSFERARVVTHDAWNDAMPQFWLVRRLLNRVHPTAPQSKERARLRHCDGKSPPRSNGVVRCHLRLPSAVMLHPRTIRSLSRSLFSASLKNQKKTPLLLGHKRRSALTASPSSATPPMCSRCKTPFGARCRCVARALRAADVMRALSYGLFSPGLWPRGSLPLQRCRRDVACRHSARTHAASRLSSLASAPFPLFAAASL